MNPILKTLSCLLFLILPFGQLTRLPIPHPSVKIYLHDLIVGLILAGYLLTRPKKLPRLSKPILIFFLAGILSLLIALPHFPAQQLTIAGLYLFRWLAYAALYFVFADQKLKLPLTKLLTLSLGALAVFALTQYLFLPDTRFLASANWDDHYYRVIATLGDPSYVGILLLFGLILVFFKSLAWWLYPLYLLPLLLTYSRSTYLALITGALTAAIIKKRFKLIIISLIIFLFTLPFLPRPGGEGVKLERLFSITSRLTNYQEGISIIKQSPLFGVGFNTLRYYRHQQGSLGDDWLESHAASGLDSSLLFILATTGIVGFLAYFNLLKNIWSLSDLAKVALIALLTHSLFQNSLFYPWVMIYCWALFGIV